MNTVPTDFADVMSNCYPMLFEHNPVPMCVYDAASLRLLAANAAAVAHFGYSLEELLKLTLPDLHPADDPQTWRALPHRIPDGQAVRHAHQHQHRSGALIAVETTTREMDANGIRVHLLVIQEPAERRLSEQHDFLAAVVNSTRDAILSVDTAGLIHTANASAEHIFGRTATSMRGQPVESLMPEPFRSIHPWQRHQFVASGVHSRVMGLGLVKGLRADGQVLDLEGTITQVTIQRQPRLLVHLRDVTARVRADAAFEQSRKQLSELTQKLMAQKKTLVKHVAQTLHDQLGQTMAAIRMAHETAVAMQSRPVSPEVSRIQSQLGMLIDQAIRQVRQVLVDLRPPLLEEQGLASALDNELRNRSLTLPGVNFSMDVATHVGTLRWPNEIEYCAFMVAREAVENALRHSNSESVAVRLSGGALSLDLEVADEGRGFAAVATPQVGHLGILGMHERARAIGATVTIESNPSLGTRMRFHWQPHHDTPVSG